MKAKDSLKVNEYAHPLDGTLEEITIRAIYRALVLNRGNRSKAGKQLQISAPTLVKWMTSHPEIRRAFPKMKNQHKASMNVPRRTISKQNDPQLNMFDSQKQRRSASR